MTVLTHFLPLLWSAAFIFLCSSVGYIANNMNPDQTTPKGSKGSSPKGSSLIRVHSVFFQSKSILGDIFSNFKVRVFWVTFSGLK